MTRGAADPGRRERIVEAALAVIATDGVHGTTHRKVAASAGVSLGSLTYYFDGLSEILESAFALLSERMSAHYRSLLASARSTQEAADAVVELICGESYASDADMRAIFEMYSYGNYNDTVRELTARWLIASRASLGLHFTEPTARVLDALIEAWPMHQTWERERLDRGYVAATVQAIIDRFEPRSTG